MSEERKTFKCGGVVWAQEGPGIYAATIAGARMEIHGQYGMEEPYPFKACKVVDGEREWIMRARPVMVQRYNSRIGAAKSVQERLGWRARQAKEPA